MHGLNDEPDHLDRVSKRHSSDTEAWFTWTALEDEVLFSPVSINLGCVEEKKFHSELFIFIRKHWKAITCHFSVISCPRTDKNVNRLNDQHFFSPLTMCYVFLNGKSIWPAVIWAHFPQVLYFGALNLNTHTHARSVISVIRDWRVIRFCFVF